MTAPFTRFCCDTCGKPIDDVEKGYVIWEDNDQGQAQNFKIIHQVVCDNDQMPFSSALSDYLGPDGLSRVLSLLSYGPLIASRSGGKPRGVANMDEFVDFVRRLQLPFYEEARPLFRDAELREDLSDANEVYPYRVETLQDLVKEYGPK